jgi:hypothetical protein
MNSISPALNPLSALLHSPTFAAISQHGSC